MTIDGIGAGLSERVGDCVSDTLVLFGIEEKRYRGAGGDTAHGESCQEILFEEFRHVGTDRKSVAVHDVEHT